MTTVQTLLTTEEAARRLRLRASDLYRLIEAGELPAYKEPSGRIVVSEEILSPGAVCAERGR